MPSTPKTRALRAASHQAQPRAATHTALGLEAAATRRISAQELAALPHATAPGFAALVEATGGALDFVHVLPDCAAPFTGRDGRGPYTYDPQKVLANFSALAMDAPIDYEHQSVMPPAGHVGPIPGAGWMVALAYIAGAGMFAAASWTPRAGELLAQREYRYFSPNVLYWPLEDNEDGGEIDSITGGALTNHPNLPLLALNARRAGGSSHTAHQPPTDAHDMDELKKALGLPETATQADVLAALTALQSKAATADAVVAEVAADAAEGAAAPTTTEAVVAAVQSRRSAATASATALATMTERATAAEGQVATLRGELHTMRVDAAIKTALQSGRLTKGAEQAARDIAAGEGGLEKLTAFLDKLPQQVPQGTQPRQAGAEGEDDAPVLTEQQKKLARVGGMTEAQFAAQLKAGKKST